MSIEAKKDAASPLANDPAADLQAVVDAVESGRPVDTETSRRIEARAEQVRAELRKHGTTNVALDLLRESRDE